MKPESLAYIDKRWIGYGSLHAPDTNEVQWRFPLSFQAVPAILLFIGLFWFPESPRYLIEKEKYEEAMRVLRKLHYDGTNNDWIEKEFTEIKATITAEMSVAAPGWLVMFKVPQWRTRLMYEVSPWLEAVVMQKGNILTIAIHVGMAH
jgi:hypothetical protein